MRTRTISMALTALACAAGGLLLGAMGSGRQPLADAPAPVPAVVGHDHADRMVMPAAVTDDQARPVGGPAAVPHDHAERAVVPPRESAPAAAPEPAPQEPDDLQAIESLLIEILEQR